MRERNQIQNSIDQYTKLVEEFENATELIELGEAENDSQIVLESEELLRDLAKTTNKLKLEAMLSGEADSNDCFVEIHAGAGGTESQDWASMLRRLYLRWAENRGFEVELVEESLGEEAGI